MSYGARSHPAAPSVPLDRRSPEEIDRLEVLVLGVLAQGDASRSEIAERAGLHEAEVKCALQRLAKRRRAVCQKQVWTSRRR